MGMFIVSESDCSVIMKALDKDGNGMIDHGEFADWILAGINRTPQQRNKWGTRSCNDCIILMLYSHLFHNKFYDLLNIMLTLLRIIFFFFPFRFTKRDVSSLGSIFISGS